ncbi:MAG: acyl carrier protein [bacterium]|jgi:acyl carrier protein
MPSTETLERVKRVVRESLRIDASATLADDMKLVGGEYEIDSLDVLLIITNIEKDFGVQIREGTMDKTAFATVQTLSGFVENLREAKG